MMTQISREPQVTVCPVAFTQLPTTTSLGEPGTHGHRADSEAELQLYYATFSLTANHELFHVAYPGSTPIFIFSHFITGVLISSFEM